MELRAEQVVFRRLSVGKKGRNTSRVEQRVEEGQRGFADELERRGHAELPYECVVDGSQAHTR